MNTQTIKTPKGDIYEVQTLNSGEIYNITPTLDITIISVTVLFICLLIFAGFCINKIIE